MSSHSSMPNKESSKLTVGTSAEGTRKLVPHSQTPTPNLPPSVDPFLSKPFPPLTPNAQLQTGESEKTTSQSSALAPGTSGLYDDRAPSPKARQTEEMLKYMKVTLSVLGELMDEQSAGSTIESVDLYEV